MLFEVEVDDEDNAPLHQLCFDCCDRILGSAPCDAVMVMSNKHEFECNNGTDSALRPFCDDGLDRYISVYGSCRAVLFNVSPTHIQARLLSLEERRWIGRCCCLLLGNIDVLQ